MDRNNLSLVFLAGALAATAVPAQRGWKQLVGQKMPAVEASKWFNNSGEVVSSGSLHGKVWILEFFATT